MEREYINILIHIGKYEFLDEESKSILTSIDDGYILYSENWTGQDYKGLSNADIICLFKGIIIAEQCYSQLCGSATIGWPIYSEIRERHLDERTTILDIPPIENFAIRNSKNPYVLGSYYFHSNPPSHLIDRWHAHEDRMKFQQEQKIIQKIERQRVSIERYKQKKEHRMKILEKYQNSTIKEKLTTIVKDTIHPPEYYPVIEISEEDIGNLPMELIKKLFNKISSRKKSEWKVIAHKLENAITSEV
jgi:hypothetical protein